jgi:hypothetical protein
LLWQVGASSARNSRRIATNWVIGNAQIVLSTIMPARKCAPILGACPYHDSCLGHPKPTHGASPAPHGAASV